MSEKTIITGLGEILWDLLPEGKQLGGAPANFVYHIQQLGYQSYMVSSIGEDRLGDEILNSLDKRGLSSKYISRSQDFPTGQVEVELDEDGNPEYNIIENVAWDYIPYSKKLDKLAHQSSAVCFGSLAQRSSKSRATVQKILKSTDENCIRIFDVNLRQNYYSLELIEENLALASILKLNEDELQKITDMFSIRGDEKEQMRKIISRFKLEMIALTKGGQGSFLVTSQKSSFLEPLDTKVKDTVGAGDSFTAGLVFSLLQGFSLEKCHQNANRLASFVCSQDGAMPSLPKKLLTQIS